MAVREFGNKMMEINARRIGEEKKKKRGLEQQQQKKKKTIKRTVSSSRVYVVMLAIFSRFVMLALFVFWRILARPYDTSAGLTRPCLSPNQNDHQVNVKWKTACSVIENGVVWDSVYYVQIAQCGYEYEQTHAFLPVLPLTMRFLANTVLNRLVPRVGYRATLAIAGYLISNVAFVYAALYLYKLTLYVVEDERQAWRATALFCFNPASVFYSSIYSESLFAFCSFAGLWNFVKGSKWMAIVLWGLSSGVRSNGVLHAGFFLFQSMHHCHQAAFSHQQRLRGVLAVVTAIMQSGAVVTPFVAFQFYGYYQHCDPSVGSVEELRPWCPARLPYLYGFVQKHYWNVGFLRYFEIKQIPNFMLASPMLALAICSLISYGKQQSRLLLSLGFRATPMEWGKLVLSPTLEQKHVKYIDDNCSADNGELRQRQQTKIEPTIAEGHGFVNPDGLGSFFSPAAVCFLVQLAVMTSVACLIMHVQVATRFLSVSPPIYWYAAHIMDPSVGGRPMGRLIWAVFFSYLGLGSLLFINFYPFT
ncbi:unnamed protein product [Sphagnum compactum]